MLYSLCTSKKYFILAPLSHSPLLKIKPCHSRPLDNGIKLILREQVSTVFYEDLSPDSFDEDTESSGSDDKILVGKNLLNTAALCYIISDVLQYFSVLCSLQENNI